MATITIQPGTTIPAGVAEPQAPGGSRLTLDPALPQRGAISGGWWPRSRDAGAELPAMLTELTARAGPVSRVALPVDAFSDIPRQLIIGGRTVHIAWFRAMNTHTINMTMSGRDSLTLLVIPPQAAPDGAMEALRLAAAGGHTGRAQDILAAAGVTC